MTDSIPVIDPSASDPNSSSAKAVEDVLEPSFELAVRYAWDWFSLHAAQRIQVLNFFFVMFALVVAGYGTAYGARNYEIAGGIAFAGALLTLIFWRLDVRGRELVRAAERALKRIERRLADATAIKSVRIVKRVDKPGAKLTSFTFAIRSFMLIAGMAFVALSVLAFAQVGSGPACSHTVSLGNQGITFEATCGDR